MISHWAANKVLPNIDFCVRLAEYYNIGLDELIGRIDKADRTHAQLKNTARRIRKRI